MNGTWNSKIFQDFPLNTFKNSDKNLKPANYIHQKYHKNDYKLIETWLETTI